MENKTLDNVDELPLFPGCEKFIGDKQKCSNGKLIAYISQNLNYPKEAKEAGIEGSVLSEFTIDVDGSLKDIKIIKSLGYGCDEEVLRVIETMNKMTQKWVPGKHDGKFVAVQLKLPFSFKLPPKED